MRITDGEAPNFTYIVNGKFTATNGFGGRVSGAYVCDADYLTATKEMRAKARMIE